ERTDVRLRRRGPPGGRRALAPSRGNGRVRATCARRLRQLGRRYADSVSRAVVLAGVRTPIGRYGGALSGVRPDDLAATVFAKPEQAFPRGNQTVWDTTLGWRFPNPNMEELFPLESMGETGENVAERWNVSREEQDAFALRSQQRWAAAAQAGRFDDELVAVDGVVRDEHPRPDTSAEKLAALEPVFRAGGTVTAGNSSGIN